MTEAGLLVLLLCAWAWLCQVAAEILMGGE